MAGGAGLTGVLNHALLDESVDEATFPLLRFLNPIDDTVFNVNQVRELIPELERLVGWAVEADELEACESLLRLARKCLEHERDAYLVFIGD